MSDYDPYSLSSGLPSDFDFTITEAYFTTDSRYNEGNTVLLKLVGTTDDADVAEHDMLLSCGSGWEITDGGKAVRSEKGGDKRFNKNSGVGLFLARALTAGAGDTMRQRGNPMTAVTWDGLVFHMDLEEIDRGSYGKKDVLLPTKFVGVAGAGTSGASGGGATPTTDSTVSPIIIAKLKAAAKSAADYGAFIEAGFGIDGVVGTPAAEALVADEAWYAEQAAA